MSDVHLLSSSKCNKFFGLFCKQYRKQAFGSKRKNLVCLDLIIMLIVTIANFYHQQTFSALCMRSVCLWILRPQLKLVGSVGKDMRFSGTAEGWIGPHTLLLWDPATRANLYSGQVATGRAHVKHCTSVLCNIFCLYLWYLRCHKISQITSIILHRCKWTQQL